VTIRPTATRRTRPHWAARPRQSPRVLAVAMMLATGLLLAGCSGNDQAPNGAATTPPAPTAPARSTAPVPATPAPSTTPPAATPPATAAPTTTPPTNTSTNPAGIGTSTSGTLRSDRCRSAELRGSITAGDGGAAGSLLPFLVLTNVGSSACTLQGWPGVSLVGGGHGTQIGAPATLDRTGEHATVTLLPRGSAHAPMRITQAANYPTATCNPMPADGFRVYPPGSRTSLFVAAPGYTGCANTAVELLNVRAFQPGAA